MHHFFPVGVGDPLRFVCFAVEIDDHGMAQSLHLARLAVTQALLHLKAGVAYFKNTTLTNNGFVEEHRLAEVQVHMDEDILEGQPIDFSLEDMLEIAASTHVEVIALRPVIDVVIRVEVAHADLDGTRKHSN